MAYADLTPQEKFVFDWQYRIAGGFDTMLAHLFCKADGFNFNNLANAFPVEAEGMRGYLHENGWWENVMIKAFEGKPDVRVIEEALAHPGIRKKPPEWAAELAREKAGMAFGYYIAKFHPAMVMPSEAIEESINAVMGDSYSEWLN